MGAGSYLTQEGGKGQPVRGPNFTGPAPTSTWFSNLVFKGKNATNEFPHPLAVRPTGNGLAIHFPGPYIRRRQGRHHGGNGQERRT